MSKIALSAVVLLSGMISPVAAQQWGAGAPAAAPAAPRMETSADPRRVPANARAHAVSDAVITEGHIARLRAALKLPPAQQPHWMPVETALSELARQQARGESVAAMTTQLRRLKAIAMPLISSLDENQKRDAINFARNMGFQQLVAAF